MYQNIEGALDLKVTEKIINDYENNPSNRIVRNALSRTTLLDAIYDSSRAVSTYPESSVV